MRNEHKDKFRIGHLDDNGLTRTESICPPTILLDCPVDPTTEANWLSGDLLLIRWMATAGESHAPMSTRALA